MITKRGPHIDIHVHCRDFESQRHKATIAEVVELARSQGVVAICDMPNTEPPLTTKNVVERRFELAESEGVTSGYYVHMGVTTDPRQLGEAVEVYNTNPKVVGFKLYAGTSVGSLAVIQEAQQRAIYNELTLLDYRGVVAVHCEKESMFRMNLWDPERPWTWNDARPPAAEVESVKDQINFALEADFKGTLHIPHISTPRAVEIVDMARQWMKITCGATPHHLAFSTSDMRSADGISLKVNPPLRNDELVDGLRYCLRNGYIDWIETDHAPHTYEEKTEGHMSGIRSLEAYATFIRTLRNDGFGEEQIRNLTYDNIKRVYTKIVE